jgi:DNA-binding CsgD family transcriptional regulator
MLSIMDENHLKFMANSLAPVVVEYLNEHATPADGLDYRYSVCIKMKDIYNKYHWHLVDTVVTEINANGFPLTTLIICTNINQIKRDQLIYYNIMKKNRDGVYEVMLEGTEGNLENEYKLTPRELQIVNLIGQGHTNKQIAHKLSISLNTVQTHRKSILRKTKCTGTAELATFAFSRGLL